MPTFFQSVPFDVLSARHGARYKWLVLSVIGTGVVAGVLSTSSFNVAVPALTRSFGLGQDQAQWTMTGFMVAMTLAMLPTSWALDRYGFRRVFLTAVTMLAVASLGGSLAPNFASVVAFRVLQGAATGVLQPLGVLTVMRLFPPYHQGKASGVLSLGIVLAPAVAPAFGGVLLDRFGWSAIFLLTIPFCVAALLAGLVLLPRPQASERRPFDWRGSVLLTVGTLALVEAFASTHRNGLLAPWTLAQALLSVAAIALYIRHARRAPQPIIGLGQFRQRVFAIGCFVSFAYGFGLYASTYLIPVFLQNVLGFSATAAGVTLIPSGIALALTIPVAGGMADRHSPRWVTVGGLACFAASFLFFALWGGAITQAELIAATVLGRIGLGLILPALNLATLRNLAPQCLAQASVVVSYARQLGGVLGIAGTAVFVEWRETVVGHKAPGIYDAYAQGFLLLAVIFVFALTAAGFMKQRPAPRPA